MNSNNTTTNGALDAALAALRAIYLEAGLSPVDTLRSAKADIACGFVG